MKILKLWHAVNTALGREFVALKAYIRKRNHLKSILASSLRSYGGGSEN
jgi:hypothetical protein